MRREWMLAEEVIGSPGRTRTADQRINSPSLYQLSYRGTEPVAGRGILEDGSRQVKATNTELPVCFRELAITRRSDAISDARIRRDA